MIESVEFIQTCGHGGIIYYTYLIHRMFTFLLTYCILCGYTHGCNLFYIVYITILITV